MWRKILLLIFLVSFTILPSQSHAEEFIINDYTFTWKASKVGNVSLRIVKDRFGTAATLSNPGGRIATLFLSGEQARAIGDALAKADFFYKKHKENWDRQSSDVVKAGDYRVTFASQEGGNDFSVTIDQKKKFSPAVHLRKDSALKIAGQLQKAAGMIAYVDKRIVP